MIALTTLHLVHGQIDLDPVVNIRIKFIGMIHEFSNPDEAKAALGQALQRVTGHNITVDSFDKTGAVWHSAQVNDCAEPKVRILLNFIQNPGKGFTREFKMSTGEFFAPPTRIEVEWLNICENFGRKRNQVTDNAPAKPDVLTTTPEPEPPKTTTETSVMTTAFLSPLEPETETETSQNLSSSILESEFSIPSSDIIETFSGDIFGSTTLNSDSTATTTIEPSTSEPAINEPSTAGSSITIEAFTTEISRTETTQMITATESLVTEPHDIPPTDIPLTEAPFISDATDKLTSETEDTEEPHYGKYVGLTTAFLIFVAYLICSRAYRRQGMYELHETQ